MLVKDNQRQLHTKLAFLFEHPDLFEAEFARACTQEIGHGRVETRCLTCTADLPDGFTGFADAQQVFRLERTRVCKRTGQVQQETVYALSSLSPQQARPASLLTLVRGHWQIENKSHPVRDVTFDEDRSQVRCGSIPQVMAALRNLCIGLLRWHGHTNIAQACRYHAAKPQEALALLGC